MTSQSLCSQCIIGKIEGKGISTSQCPTCNQPGWKRDLKPVHVLANIAQPISHLLDAGELSFPSSTLANLDPALLLKD